MDTSVFPWWGAYNLQPPELIADISPEEKASAQFGRYEEMKIKYGNRVQFIIELVLGILLLMAIYTFWMPVAAVTAAAAAPKQKGGSSPWRRQFFKLFL